MRRFPCPGERNRDMGTIKAVVGFLVIVGVVYSAFQVVPPELTNYSFQDDLRNIALMGGANPHETDQQLLDSVLQKAQERGIALTADQVTIQRIATPGMPTVFVAAEYSVPVNLPGYSFVLHFTPSSGNKA